jgi:hypothetical protein
MSVNFTVRIPKKLAERLGVSIDDLRPMSADEEMKLYKMVREGGKGCTQQ